MSQQRIRNPATAASGRMRNILSTSVALTLLATLACTGERKEPADGIFLHAEIFSGSRDSPGHDTLVVRNGEILFVGSATEAQASYESDRTYNLEGRFVMPGMIDSHAHPGLVALIGEENEGPSALPHTNQEELFKALRKLALEAKDEPFFSSSDWDVAMFLPEGPHKRDLDLIFPDKPAILFDNSGHSLWLNSAALASFGVDRTTPDLSPGVSVFVRDESGEPTGWVKEFPLMKGMGDLLLRPREEIKDRLRGYLNFLSSKGVTTLWDAGNFELDDAIYEVLAELARNDQLPVRYFGSFHIYDPKQIDTAIPELLALRDAFGSPELTFETIKIHYDGVVEVGTAGMLEPYLVGAGQRGGFLFSAERLAVFLVELDENAIDLHLHSVGDRSTREILDAVEQAQTQLERPLEIEVTISHLEHVHPDDVSRFAQLGVHANFTPHWWGGTFFGRAGEMHVGEELIHNSQSATSLLAHGANVTLSSDVTTLANQDRANPFVGLQMSVTRQEFTDGAESVRFGSEDSRMTLEQALVGYTAAGALQLGLEDTLGTIEVGMRADFLVLEQSPFETNTYALHTLHPEAVFLNGLLVQGGLD